MMRIVVWGTASPFEKIVVKCTGRIKPCRATHRNHITLNNWFLFRDQELKWDSNTMRVTNLEQANAVIKPEFRTCWQVG